MLMTMMPTKTLSSESVQTRLPQNKEEAELVERALAAELANLSVVEREQILHDIHGVREATSADDVNLASKLEELDREIAVLVAQQKATAYERARTLDRSFVEDETLRTVFLRTEDFDARKAAQRLTFHFQTKRELFVRKSNSDDRILVRHVTWDDLDEEDRQVARSGLFYVGSRRDLAGRLVVYITPAVIQPHWMAQNISRVSFYHLMSALRTDEDMRTKGAVMINLAAKPPPSHMLRQLIRSRSGLPSVTAAMHVCYDSPAMHLGVVAMRLVLSMYNPRQSFRMRFHYGTRKHIGVELQTFGIPVESGPFAQLLNNYDDGNLMSVIENMSVGAHLDWLQAVRRTELVREAGSPECVVVPRRVDVLFGRDRRNWEHPGTIRCRHLVRVHREAYENASRRDKTKVADKVVELVHASEGRFLKWEKANDATAGFWVVVTGKAAREKISHMFRHRREVAQRISGGRGIEESSTSVTIVGVEEPTIRGGEVATYSNKVPLSPAVEAEQPLRKLRRTQK